MNPVTYSLQFIKRSIPREILEYIFLSNLDRYALSATSLDARIRASVLTPWVFVDCNLVGGVETSISLEGVPGYEINRFERIYTVPKTLTSGRTITRVLSVSFGDGAIVGINNIAPSQGNAYLDAAQGLLNSASPIPQVGTANAMLVGENTVHIKDNFALAPNVYLRCWLENDKDFNHIQPQSYPAFAKLVLLAVKAYIYTNAQIPMDKGFIHAGAELGRFREVIDGYSDANEQYDTHLRTVWRKVAYLNDFEAHRRHLQRLLGGPN